MLLVSQLDIYALLDLGATLSFVTPYIVFKFDVSGETISKIFLVCTLVSNLIKS